MHQINLVVALAAATVVVLGLFSKRTKRSWLSVPLMALAAGVLAGPVGLGLVRPDEWPHAHTILKEVARFTLAVSVTGIALRTPPGDFRQLAVPVGVLLTFGMVAMWLVSSATAWAILSLAPLSALLLGAAITPTDPVVASAIVTGSPAEEHLSDRLRSTLSLESGANDGLGYLIVMLPALLILRGQNTATFEHWLIEVVGVGVIVAIAIGAAIGLVTGRMLRLSEARGWVAEHSMLSLSIAMSILALTGAALAGSDGILAAFAAGMAFNLSVTPNERFEEENVQEAISKLFNLPIFVLTGIMLPIAGWASMPVQFAALAIAVLLLRRPIAIALTLLPMRRRYPLGEITFLGWFGPVGVAAIYYAILAQERTGEPVYWHATAAVVTASIVLHGMTAWPAMKALSRRQPQEPNPG